jgi:hypothetical protein
MRTARGHTCMVLSAACMQGPQVALRTLEVIDDRIWELVASVAVCSRLFFHVCPLVARRIMLSQILDRDPVQVCPPPRMAAMHSLVTVQLHSALHMAAHVAAELPDGSQLQLTGVHGTLRDAARALCRQSAAR